MIEIRCEKVEDAVRAAITLREHAGGIVRVREDDGLWLVTLHDR